MNSSLALGIALRGSLVIAISLAAMPALRRASAVARRWLILLGLASSLAVPLLVLALPREPVIRVSAPVFVGHVVAEALTPNSAEVREQVRRPATVNQTFALPSAETWAALIWAVGALWVGARVLRGQIWAMRVRSSARPHPEMHRVRVTSRIEAPVVVGAFRPIVLLPSESQSWSEERLRAVLLHEFAHVRRFDGLALLLAQLTWALYWFQPLAWMARNRLRRECELAADEAVIASGFRPSSYAEHLLEIARGLIPVAGIAMAARPSELGHRIRTLVSRERLPDPFTRRHAAVLGALTAIVVACVACVGATSPSNAKSAAKTGKSPLSAEQRDARLQAITDEEARRLHADWGAERVSIVVLDSSTGALLASFDDEPGAPIVPASTLKPITVATALDAEVITTQQRFDCGNGARNYGSLVLRDAGSYGSLNAAEILAVSSNIGASRIFDALGGARLGEGLRRFRVGAPAEIPDGTMRGALIALGAGTTTTPLALATAYGVFANDGMLPAAGHPTERVIRASTATAVRGMLEAAVSGEQATGKAAAVAGAKVGGKTGTRDDSECEACAQAGGTFANFVGIVPIDAPRWIIYVGVGKPRVPGSGGTIAAPAFSRIATRALAL